MNCVYNILNKGRKSPLWPRGPAQGETWNDHVLRRAENFATAAASDSVDYPESWGAHNAAGIWLYQYVLKPMKGKRYTAPVSDEAYRAGIAGKYFHNRAPSEALRWCNQCESQ